MTPAPYRFYAAEISYFSGKVRPALRQKGVAYVEHLPTPDVYRKVILPRTGLGFIPVVVTPDDETWQDTSEILDALEARHPEPGLYPKTPVQRTIAYLLELYADEFLVLPAMHYRWSFPESVRKARGDFAASNGDPVAAGKFADRMSGSVRAIGVVPESIPAIEAHTADLLDALSAHFAAQPAMLGSRMSLADCALMGPFYGHLYQDLVPGLLLRERAPLVCNWIERMNHPDPTAPGTFVPDDALSPTLRPLLELVGRDAVPLLLDTLGEVERWADERPTDLVEPPRALGFHETALRGAKFPRYTSPYTLWMAQRSLDAYAGAGAAGREQIDAALAGTGCEALFAYRPRHRLGKRRFKLAFETGAA